MVDEVGNAANIPPEQMGATGLNVGVIIGLTIIIALPDIAAVQSVERYVAITVYEPATVCNPNVIGVPIPGIGCPTKVTPLNINW